FLIRELVHLVHVYNECFSVLSCPIRINRHLVLKNEKIQKEIRMNYLLGNQDEYIREILKDNKVSFSEYKRVRDEADFKFANLVLKIGANNDATAFQKSTDVTVQLMQNLVLDIKKRAKSDLDETILKDAIVAQVNYLQIATKLFIDKL
ncbi:hypothetical protein NB620_10440, partial [Vibrio alginolyticus]|uniref:hypothetical protein n=1 Tax=Vibrio alginolyticus TaxID=663 RepID=UPI00215C542B